jgi:4'-phosphopantetheinyl transferase
LWLPAPEKLVLSQDKVEIWRANLDQPKSCQAQLAATLSREEQTRAERFHFDLHRQRFITGRGILRNILSRYLGKDPRELEFCYSDRGKPSLVSKNTKFDLRFNLSHSQDLALYAIALDRDLGIDLEFIRQNNDAVKIAQRFFSPHEYKKLLALAEDQQQRAFFDIWTCKEAYLKATGEGLVGLQQVEVSLASGEAPRLLLSPDTMLPSTKWFLEQLTPNPNYAGAVAVAGEKCQLSYWHWSP